MKYSGKQARHLTVCPELCQAQGQKDELTQHVITAHMQCQAGRTWSECSHPSWPRETHSQDGTSICVLAYTVLAPGFRPVQSSSFQIHPVGRLTNSKNPLTQTVKGLKKDV